MTPVIRGLAGDAAGAKSATEGGAACADGLRDVPHPPPRGKAAAAIAGEPRAFGRLKSRLNLPGAMWAPCKASFVREPPVSFASSPAEKRRGFRVVGLAWLLVLAFAGLCVAAQLIR